MLKSKHVILNDNVDRIGILKTEEKISWGAKNKGNICE